MNVAVIPGVQYGKRLRTGEWVALVPNVGVQTHQGLVPFPEGWGLGLLFLDLTAVGGFRFAGKRHTDGQTMEYVGGQWFARGLSNGDCAFIYDNAGLLHIIAPGPNVTSQGYRNVAADGSLVLGDATYGPLHQLSQYIDIGGGRLIGQGDPQHGVVEGALVWDLTQHRVLELGYAAFIHVDGVGGSDFAISMTTQTGVVLYDVSLAELLALPLAAIVPPQYPDPKPAPLPAPPVEPPVSYDPSLTSTWTDAQLTSWVRAELDLYRSTDDASYWVQAIRTHPSSGSPDVLYWDGRIKVGDGAGKASGPAPAPDPQPQPPSFDPGALLIRLAALEQRAMTAEQRIAALEAKPDPVMPGVDLHGYAKKGDPVTVGGKVNVFGVNRWTGSIDK